MSQKHIKLQLESTHLAAATKHCLQLLEYEVKFPTEEQIQIAVHILRAAIKRWEKFEIDGDEEGT